MGSKDPMTAEELCFTMWVIGQETQIARRKAKAWGKEWHNALESIYDDGSDFDPWRSRIVYATTLDKAYLPTVKPMSSSDVKHVTIGTRQEQRTFLFRHHKWSTIRDFRMGAKHYPTWCREFPLWPGSDEYLTTRLRYVVPVFDQSQWGRLLLFVTNRTKPKRLAQRLIIQCASIPESYYWGSWGMNTSATTKQVRFTRTWE